MTEDPQKRCEEELVNSYKVVSDIDKIVERAYDAHASIYKAFGDLAGINTIRKDKSVAEAAKTDISYTLEMMHGMVGSISQIQKTIERIEAKPREKLISDEMQQLLDEYSPYLRLMSEHGTAPSINKKIELSVKELDISAMRLQIGESGEGLSKNRLDRKIEELNTKHPNLEINTMNVSDRTLLLIIKIPTIAQMSLNMKQIGGESDEYEVSWIQILSDDEVGPFSKFLVFERIGYDANILWFSIAGFSVEHRLSKLVQWFSLFEDLFSATCCVCNRHLQMDSRTSQYLPPTWRGVDIKGNEPSRAYHYGCLESA